MLRLIYYGIYITADISRHVYYGRYIMADILRQIFYGRSITADTLRQIYCVPQKRPYLDKFPAPEALDCCIRICLLQRIPCGPPLGPCGHPGPLWAGPLWAPLGPCGPPGPLWAGPLWAPLGPYGPGPCGPTRIYTTLHKIYMRVAGFRASIENSYDGIWYPGLWGGPGGPTRAQGRHQCMTGFWVRHQCMTGFWVRHRDMSIFQSMSRKIGAAGT